MGRRKFLQRCSCHHQEEVEEESQNQAAEAVEELHQMVEAAVE